MDVEGVEYSQPGCDDIRPPGWNVDSVLDLSANVLLFIAGHAGGR